MDNENENIFPLDSFMKIAESVSDNASQNKEIESAISALAKSLNEFEIMFQKNKNDPVILNAIIQKYYYNNMLLEKLKSLGKANP